MHRVELARPSAPRRASAVAAAAVAAAVPLAHPAVPPVEHLQSRLPALLLQGFDLSVAEARRG
jgi:hypothetical protein